MFKPCIDCGVVSDETRCPDHRQKHSQKRQRDYPKASATARGYDAAWQRTSAQARRLQPFCSDCDGTDDLTTEHSADAWQAWIEKRPITLAMVEVLCRPCNSRRGTPFEDQGDDPRLPRSGPTAPQQVSVTHRRSPTQERERP